MENLLEWDKILNINFDLIETATKYNDTNILLSDSEIRYYDVIDIKQKLLSLFSKFRSAKYLSNYSVANNSQLTPSLESREYQSTRLSVSQLEKSVNNFIDKHIWITDFYRSIMLLGTKLTKSEAIYLINTFLCTRTEEDIAEKLGICKTSLQKIKKSCLVKMWIELKIYYDEND